MVMTESAIEDIVLTAEEISKIDTVQHQETCTRKSVPVETLLWDCLRVHVCVECGVSTVQPFTKEEKFILDNIQHKRNCPLLRPAELRNLGPYKIFACRDCGEKILARAIEQKKAGFI